MERGASMGRGGGRVYVGERTADRDRAVFVEEGGRRRPLPHVVHHSPSGLSWGYPGSGPADTALSILADALGERPGRDDLYALRRQPATAAAPPVTVVAGRGATEAPRTGDTIPAPHRSAQGLWRCLRRALTGAGP